MNFINNNQPNEVALDKIFNKGIITTRDGLWRCKENDGFGISKVGRIVKEAL